MRDAAKLLTFSLIAATLWSVPATAQEETDGRRLAQMAFASLDEANRGFIDQGEFSNFGGDVFVSMDTDGDNNLSLPEFLSWDYGMAPLAAEAGREDAYETALRVVHAFWDRNGDGVISRTEHRQSLNFDFQRADTDNDALLTEDEFTGGFSVMVALRAAINPAPAE
ncbi:signal transduction protein [Cognatiyoonia sp. IB215446]|uniref:EF-hand domain-containing protein n=1 Tax=Cognatiyoonia sp. IB215446 TaxID=3097355 RepID=UPI002A18697E|nr:signal transduction protein [Cognatiyoonia sp. IB215446]MDX8350038.1 signal transduction protein [Cognatiyoonia sp. IB215446]